MKKRGQDLLAIGLGVVAIAALVGVVTWLARRPDRALDARGCLRDGEPVSNSVLLLDVSDRLSDLQRGWLETRLDSWASGIPTGGRAQVFTLHDAAAPVVSAFDGCNPGDGSDADWLTANPERLRKRWRTLFREPIDAKLTLDDGTKAWSPLVEGLQMLSVRAGLEGGGPTTVTATPHSPPRSLLLVSDLMQHSEAFSMYAAGCLDPETTLQQNGQRWRANLVGVSVRILLLRREGDSCAPDALVRWWRELLSRMEAQLEVVEVAPGLAPGAALPEPAP